MFVSTMCLNIFGIVLVGLTPLSFGVGRGGQVTGPTRAVLDGLKTGVRERVSGSQLGFPQLFFGPVLDQIWWTHWDPMDSTISHTDGSPPLAGGSTPSVPIGGPTSAALSKLAEVQALIAEVKALHNRIKHWEVIVNVDHIQQNGMNITLS